MLSILPQRAGLLLIFQRSPWGFSLLCSIAWFPPEKAIGWVLLSGRSRTLASVALYSNGCLLAYPLSIWPSSLLQYTLLTFPHLAHTSNTSTFTTQVSHCLSLSPQCQVVGKASLNINWWTGKRHLILERFLVLFLFWTWMCHSWFTLGMSASRGQRQEETNAWLWTRSCPRLLIWLSSPIMEDGTKNRVLLIPPLLPGFMNWGWVVGRSWGAEEHPGP